MLTCDQARLLMHYGAEPGSRRKGLPELGFHLAACPACRALWRSLHHAAHQEPYAAESHASGDRAPRALYPNIHVPAADELTDGANDSSAGRPTIRLDDVAAPVEQVDLRLPARSDESAGNGFDAALPANDGFGADEGASPERPPATFVSYRTLLQNRNFRLLWLGQAVSTFGSLFTRIAIPIYVYNLTDSLSQLGLAAFSSLVAPLCFGLFAGALVDRWDRRRTMLAVDIISAAVLLILMGLSLLELSLPLKLASLYAINFVMALLRELFNPARVAIFPEVVKEEELLTANSLDQATTTFGELLSYPIAGFALFYFGASIAFGIDALTFLLSAVLLWGVRTRVAPRASAEQSTLLQEVIAGLAVVRRLPTVWAIAVLSLLVPMLMSLHNTLQLPFVVDALRSTKEVGYPAIEGAMALGFALGMLLVGRWGPRISRTALLTIGIIGYGIALMLQGVMPYGAHLLAGDQVYRSLGAWTLLLVLALPCALLTGAFNSFTFASIRTILQEETPAMFLGRAAAIVSVAASVGFAVGALLTGLGQNRVAWLITLVGGLMAVIGVLSHWWFGYVKHRAALRAASVLEYGSANVRESAATF